VLSADFLSPQAILPASAGLLASIMAIHSLVQPSMTSGRKIVCAIYALSTVLITIGLFVYGAIQHQDTREQVVAATEVNHKLDQLRALMGNNPNLSGPQVLQGMIDRFSKPYELSDPQIVRLAQELYLIKDQLQNPVRITVGRLVRTFRYHSGSEAYKCVQ
jgi:hypothetical protein